ncbi:MFS transporter [Nocardia fluminea]|uniref:MFS transporter n=1 Tax=Nocardia fluminea TaxID=134984 RepID=UPI003D0B8C27
MPRCTSVSVGLLVAIAWCVGQAVMNVYQAAITSVVPDRVPLERRGTASAAVGLGVPLGSVIGVVPASIVADHYSAGYLALGLLLAVAAVIFTAGAPEQRVASKKAVPLRDQAAAFLSVLREHDFRWAFIGRTLLVLGHFCVVGYQLYILQDHIRLSEGMKPATAVAILTPISAVGMTLSTIVGGGLSDRLDRRKPFVAISSLLAAAVVSLAGYSPLFILGGLLSVLGALAVAPIRSVR